MTMQSQKANIAVIGGSGVYDPDMLDNISEISVATEYGVVGVLLGDYCGNKVAFISRHGKGHCVPPHLINYRANIMALKKLGVNTILATAAVGSLNQQMKPGDFVAIDQFLDFTKCREHTFYTGDTKGVMHVGVTQPYCRRVRRIILSAGAGLEVVVHDGGTYVCAEGPRYETAAEIKMYKMLGGDVVGMTSVPEVVLAREAGICYATIAMITNFAAGIAPYELTHSEVLSVMEGNSHYLRSLIMKIIGLLPQHEKCSCHYVPEIFGM